MVDNSTKLARIEEMLHRGETDGVWCLPECDDIPWLVTRIHELEAQLGGCERIFEAWQKKEGANAEHEMLLGQHTHGGERKRSLERVYDANDELLATVERECWMMSKRREKNETQS